MPIIEGNIEAAHSRTRYGLAANTLCERDVTS